ncbi:MAG: chaperone modulator CbpM [Bdellovibrionota bacterium]
MKLYSLEELCIEVAIEEETLESFIQREWLKPLDQDTMKFDDEDMRRLVLILELQRDFNVNEEGLDIILHLLDQLNSLKKLTLHSKT